MQQPSRLQLLSLRIFPQLAARLPGFAVVWWYARHIDQRFSEGSGKAGFAIDVAAAMLGKTPGTVKAYLRSCHKSGLFRHVKIRGNEATVYYSSLKRAAELFQVDSIGASGFVSVHELEHLRLLITEVQAEILQQQSLYAMYEAQKQRQQTNKPRCNTLTDVFDLETCDISREYSSSVIYRGGRCIFVDSSFTAFGASQATIGDRLGVSDRTVRSRLSNRNRSRYNQRRSQKGKSSFRLVKKRQLALEQTERENFEELKSVALAVGDCELYSDFIAEQKRHYSYGDRQYRLGCNVYLFTEFEINSAKARQYFTSLTLKSS